MSEPDLINVADLKALVNGKGGNSIKATAKPLVFSGYFLSVNIKGEDKLLSTYLSDKPRTFKRADAVIKETKNIGFREVTFALTGDDA